jgi:uncharacterized protein (TIGR02594 family)
MSGISSKAAAGVENKRKFNDGTELESKEFSDGSGLELYATEFRSYDAQIGRFHQIDPLVEFSFNWSGYTFVQNNPILYNDPYGLDTLNRNKDGSLPTARPDGSPLQPNDVSVNPFGPTPYWNGQKWEETKDLQEVVVTSVVKKKEDAQTETPQTETPWMDKAKSQLGVAEDKRPGKSNPEIIKYHATTGAGNDDFSPWCASFVNWCFVQSNIPSLNSARAFDYKTFGVQLNKPAYGAIAVMNYSHVGFVAGINSDGRIVLLGGNQADAVNYSPNAVSSVLQYRYPTGFKPNYNLPSFKLTGRSTNASSSR